MTDTKKSGPATAPTKADEPTKADRLRTVYVVLTAGGRVLGDRHHQDADAAADALTAAAVPGVILAAQVLADEADETE